MLEVANGEYGDFTPQMAKAAIDDRWRVPSAYLTTNETVENLQPIDQFEMEPTKTPATRMNSNDSSYVHKVPSEWAKFWVLVGRCHIHYYRDWVVQTNILKKCKLIDALIFSLDCVSFETCATHCNGYISGSNVR